MAVTSNTAPDFVQAVSERLPLRLETGRRQLIGRLQADGVLNLIRAEQAG